MPASCRAGSLRDDGFISDISSQGCCITTQRLTDLAGRLFFDTVPTLSAVGPIEKLAPMEEISHALTAPSKTEQRVAG